MKYEKCNIDSLRMYVLTVLFLFIPGNPIYFLNAHLGDIVTLQCFPSRKSPQILWYKQTAGGKPQLITTIFRLADGVTFHNDFKDNPRFTVPGGKGVFHLRISNIQPSDSAIYYCCGLQMNLLIFVSGTSKTVLQQPVSVSVQPGDSVTLNCTINTGTCEGEHSVYWFRRDSGESPPGIIYTNGDRSGQCMKSPESGSPTQSCVYNLPKRNLSLSDTGTYYCAVESGGEILFGNGTNLEVKVSFFNSCLHFNSIGRLNHPDHCTYLHYLQDEYDDVSAVLLCSSQNQDADNLHYVALNLNKNMSRRQRNNMEEEPVVVYAGIRQ
uniref:Ig-like domain-containing protein n=1 Tax=Esox lucius TaxID=8010 RepID=A0A3P9AKJ1_ESOLU